MENQVIYDIRFDAVEDMEQFSAETEVHTNEVKIENGILDIDAVKGATIWFKEKLIAPVQIEYTAIVVDKGGSNDRVSDLNCFFMALDPQCPSNIFDCPNDSRTGRFPDYHRLRTYYVGFGGHDNTTTRMRRYPGFTKERPLLKEHDLGFPHLIRPNEPISIKIQVLENSITYIQDESIVFQMDDTLAYHEGWFAFRTVRNHMQILDFKVTQLK